jgi:hypothetical protein
MTATIPRRSPRCTLKNFEDTTVFQGIAYDIPRYLELASETGDPVLDLCCGTERVTISLAQKSREAKHVRGTLAVDR